MGNSSPKKVAGKWNHLFVCPNPVLFQALTGLLAEATPNAGIINLPAYPSRRALLDVIATQAPTVCFLDVGSDWDSAVALIVELSNAKTPVPVVAIGNSNDPDLILRCLRQGANEFLFQPFAADQVTAALERLSKTRRNSAADSRELGKVYCLMPGKGACGATTIAHNLAFHLQRANPRKKVLLADLDPATGTLAFLLKLRSTYSFVDALVHASQMDEDIWKGLVTNQQGVDVMLSPESPLEGAPSIHDAPAMLDYSRENYASVVLDSAGAYGEWELTLARLSDDLLLVSTNELPALHATQRAIAHLERNGVERSKIKLLVNRYNPEAGLGREAIETALETEVFHILPSDYESVQKSLLDGKPIPATSILGKSMVSIAERLSGRQPDAKGKSMLSGIFSLFENAVNKA